MLGSLRSLQKEQKATTGSHRQPDRFSRFLITIMPDSYSQLAQHGLSFLTLPPSFLPSSSLSPSLHPVRSLGRSVIMVVMEWEREVRLLSCRESEESIGPEIWGARKSRCVRYNNHPLPGAYTHTHTLTFRHTHTQHKDTYPYSTQTYTFIWFDASADTGTHAHSYHLSFSLTQCTHIPLLLWWRRVARQPNHLHALIWDKA